MAAQQPTKADFLKSLKPLNKQECVSTDLISNTDITVPHTNHSSQPICFENMENATQLPCKHIYCLKCIKMWLKDMSNSCPTCRTSCYYQAEIEEEDGWEEQRPAVVAGPLAAVAAVAPPPPPPPPPVAARAAPPAARAPAARARAPAAPAPAAAAELGTVDNPIVL